METESERNIEGGNNQSFHIEEDVRGSIPIHVVSCFGFSCDALSETINDGRNPLLIVPPTVIRCFEW